MPDVNNGIGIRMTIWISGCTRNCQGCHNKWLQEYGQGKLLTQNMNTICNLFTDNLDGITISGGDPLDQTETSIQQLTTFCQLFKRQYPTKTIWLYSGDTWEHFYKDNKDLLKYIDIVVDGRFDKDKKDTTLKFCGSTNQRLIDVQKSLERNTIILI